jgi:hypothetical protein
MITDLMLCISVRRSGVERRKCDLILMVMLVEQGKLQRDGQMRRALELLVQSGRVRDYSRMAGRVIWSARKKFNTSVLLPVAFYIGVAASVFYDAYQKLGENSTA